MRLLILAFTMLMLVPASANAGVLELKGRELHYNAYAGEVNDVTVTRESKLTFVFSDATGSIDARNGCTNVSATQARCTYTGPAREPTILRSIVYLQDRDDKLRGEAYVNGMDGDDTIVLDGSQAEARGDAGNDDITARSGYGGDGADVLRTAPGTDGVLRGDDGDDRLEGGTNDDTLNGGAGADRLVSGGGRDTIDFSDPTRPAGQVVFTMDPEPQGGRVGEADTYEGTFAHVIGGGAVGSSLTGNDIANELTSRGTIRGLGGDDELRGADGNLGQDRLEGGPGDDELDDSDDTEGSISVLDGGDGDDRIDAVDLFDQYEDDNRRQVDNTPDQISCGDGKDRVDVDAADPRPADCEIVAFVGPLVTRITGTDTGEVLDGVGGEAEKDVIHGRAGNDVLLGLGGGDELFGQDGNDRLEGDPSSGHLGPTDILSGGDGNDHLIGGNGPDRLTGGRGADRFSGGDGNDAIGARDGRRDKVRCGRGRDRVTADRGDSVARDCEVVSRR
jgi:Ca2+-binding RTX toxin-like protein